MATKTVPVESLPDVPTTADEGEPPGDDETQAVVVPPPNLGLKLDDEPFWSTNRWLNKGNVSNMVTFVIMIVFIILKMNDDANLAIDYGLAFGLFGFAVRTPPYRPFHIHPPTLHPTPPLSPLWFRGEVFSTPDTAAKTQSLCLCVSVSICLCV